MWRWLRSLFGFRDECEIGGHVWMPWVDGGTGRIDDEFFECVVCGGVGVPV